MLPESPYEHATCPYFSAGTCRSCALLGVEPGKRIETKEALVRAALSLYGITPLQIEAIRAPAYPWGSRCKTKVSVTGTTASPSLGIVRSDLSTQDLSECPLTPLHVQALFITIKRIISEAHLTPYDVTHRTGELKHILVMSNHDASEGMVRFVLRSSEAIPRIRKQIASLQAHHPWITVVSCNIQPIPAAILEGPIEEILTERRVMDVTYNSLSLSFMPQSFMQVTHEIAATLYERASAYVRERSFSHALDLFCGVGGFSLSIAPFVRRVSGIEVSPMAVESARNAAARLGYGHVSFYADDVELFLSKKFSEQVDLIIVNPPRRGLSEEICSELLRLRPSSIIYSSCAPETFARDLHYLSRSYTVTLIAPFDMFPMTEHCEVFGILELM